MHKMTYQMSDTDTVDARPGRITIEADNTELLVELEDTTEYELALKLCHALLDCLVAIPTNDHAAALAADVASAKALIVKLARLHMELEHAKACTCTWDHTAHGRLDTSTCPLHSKAAYAAAHGEPYPVEGRMPIPDLDAPLARAASVDDGHGDWLVS